MKLKNMGLMAGILFGSAILNGATATFYNFFNHKIIVRVTWGGGEKTFTIDAADKNTNGPSTYRLDNHKLASFKDLSWAIDDDRSFVCTIPSKKDMVTGKVYIGVNIRNERIVMVNFDETGVSKDFYQRPIGIWNGNTGTWDKFPGQ